MSTMFLTFLFHDTAAPHSWPFIGAPSLLVRFVEVSTNSATLAVATHDFFYIDTSNPVLHHNTKPHASEGGCWFDPLYLPPLESDRTHGSSSPSRPNASSPPIPLTLIDQSLQNLGAAQILIAHPNAPPCAPPHSPPGGNVNHARNAFVGA